MCDSLANGSLSKDKNGYNLPSEYSVFGKFLGLFLGRLILVWAYFRVGLFSSGLTLGQFFVHKSGRLIIVTDFQNSKGN